MLTMRSKFDTINGLLIRLQSLTISAFHLGGLKVQVHYVHVYCHHPEQCHNVWHCHQLYQVNTGTRERTPVASVSHCVVWMTSPIGPTEVPTFVCAFFSGNSGTNEQTQQEDFIQDSDCPMFDRNIGVLPVTNEGCHSTR